MSLFDVIPVIFSGFFSTAVILVIVVAVMIVRRERRRVAELHAHAAQYGWQPITGPVPEPVARDARARHCKLALGVRRGPHHLWVVWHQWIESTGGGQYSSSRKRNRTHYYLWLGPGYPDVSLRRRTGMGGLFKPVRGVGTGDAAFDKAFLVRPGDSDEPRRLLTPPLREAMLAQRLPLWSITDGVLITTYNEVPRVENLQGRADAICYVADTLGRGLGRGRPALAADPAGSVTAAAVAAARVVARRPATRPSTRPAT
jgi:hypothetical protein